MGPRDWMETIKEAVERIGTTKDTGGSQTAGTVMGKENEILRMMKNGGMAFIKSIQRGTGSMRDTTSASITINTVNPDKTVVLLDSSCGVSGSIEATLQNIYANRIDVRTSNNPGSVYTLQFSWQAVEFY